MSIQRVCISLLVIGILATACAPAAQTAAPPTAALPTPTSIRPAAAPPTRGPGCTVTSRLAQNSPTQPSVVPAFSAGDWSLGSPQGPVQIMAYCDFQSPGCAYLTPVLQALAEKYPDDLHVVYRHYPLITLYDKSAPAVQAAEAAGKQDKFWEMADRLYEEQQEWSELSPEEFQTWLGEQAGDLGLDVEQFEQDRSSPELARLAADAYEQNAALQMSGVPFLLLNGETYQGPPSAGDLDAVIALLLLEERQYSDCPPQVIDPSKQYLAILDTAKGKVTLELFADKAPLAVNSFVFLAREGWFDGVTFHRVLPTFVAQAGDPTGTGYGGPGYAFDNELSDLTFDGPGVVAMANAGPGSNGSQFFITYAAVPRLDGGYTIFGRVISGMEVVTNLTPRDPSQSGDLPPGDVIRGVEIQEK